MKNIKVKVVEDEKVNSKDLKKEVVRRPPAAYNRERIKAEKKRLAEMGETIDSMREKSAAGRPSIYTKEFIEAEADAFEAWLNLPTSIYFKRFAFERKYSPNRMFEFADANEKFSGVMKRAQMWQEMRLAEGGLTNEFNPGFTKFVMGNVCGWSEKVESKITGDAANPLGFILNKSKGKTKELVKDEDDDDQDEI